MPQFQASTIDELMKPALINQEIADRNRAMISQEKARMADTIVRTEDEGIKRKLTDNFKLKADEIIKKNNGDLARAGRDLWPEIERSRSAGEWVNLKDIKQKQEENYRIQAELNAKGLPFYDYGNAVNQSLYDESGQRRDLSYKTVGFDKDYRQYQEQYVNNTKASDLGDNFAQLAAQMGNPNATLPDLMRYSQKEGIQFDANDRKVILDAYMGSGYGQQQLEKLQRVDGLNKEQAESQIFNEIQSVANEYEFVNSRNQIINNIGVNDARRKAAGEAQTQGDLWKRNIGTTVKNFGGYDNLLRKSAIGTDSEKSTAKATLSLIQNKYSKVNPEYKEILNQRPAVPKGVTFTQDEFEYFLNNKEEYTSTYSASANSIEYNQLPDSAGFKEYLKEIGKFENKNLNSFSDYNKKYDEWKSKFDNFQDDLEEFINENQIQVTSSPEFFFDNLTEKKYSDLKTNVKGIDPNQWDFYGDEKFQEALENDEQFVPARIEDVHGLQAEGNGKIGVTYKDSKGEYHRVQMESKMSGEKNELFQVARQAGIENETRNHLIANKIYPQAEEIGSKFGADKSVVFYVGDGIYYDDEPMTNAQLYQNKNTRQALLKKAFQDGAIYEDQNGNIVEAPWAAEYMNQQYIPSSSLEAGKLLNAYFKK